MAARYLAAIQEDDPRGYRDAVTRTYEAGGWNDWALRALAHCTTPTSGLNVSGPAVRIRDLGTVARRLAGWRRNWGDRRRHPYHLGGSSFPRKAI